MRRPHSPQDEFVITCAPVRHQPIDRLGRAVGQRHVDDVLRVVDARIVAVLDRPEVVAAADHALGEQKPGRQLAIGARRAHDHRERAIVQTDLERLLGRRAVGVGAALAPANADDVDGAQRLGHRHHLTRYDAVHGQAHTAGFDRPARSNAFRRATTKLAGSTGAFAMALGVIVVWALLGPLFRFSDTWQLVINTGTTIITFLMVFLIQRSQNKDSLAIHLKLNELVAAVQGASNRLVDVESLSEKELETLHRHYGELATLARKRRRCHRVALGRRSPRPPFRQSEQKLEARSTRR